MRRLVYYAAVTLDGWIASTDGCFDFFYLDGGHMQAQIEELPETLPSHVRHLLGITAPSRRFDTVVMGRLTHQVAVDAGLTSGYRHLAQHVFTRCADFASDESLTVHRSDPVGAVRALKGRPGLDIWLCGGGNLAGQLVDEIDELILKVHPVVLGDGTPLFGGHHGARAYRLVASRHFDNGVIVNRYER